MLSEAVIVDLWEDNDANPGSLSEWDQAQDGDFGMVGMAKIEVELLY